MAVAAGVGAWAAANAGTIAAVSTAVSVAATAASFYQQSQQAKAQEQAAKKQNEQLAQQAIESYDDLTPAEIDAQRNAADMELQQKAEALQAKGRVNVFAAASGTAGQSVDSMLFNIDAIKARNTNEILRQREAGLFSIKQQAEQSRQGAISNMSREAIQRPSWVEAGLKIGTQTISGLANYDQKNRETFSKQEKATVRSSV
ncbi:internal virion protein [Escherichia phage ECBP5]|uniref:Internal virion protein n=1 Tax=Escherichia phage ECBP5 TaxID=1498172 RepID=A0A0F6N5L8_9CAUD|nr:internal virion protein [Escherichia phage ECBP5]AID17696.1 hypothetical protein ECBP5_0042 [Escherichia phage ECBP5]